MPTLWQTIQNRSPPTVQFFVAVTATAVGAVGAVCAVRRWIISSRISKKIKKKREKCKTAFETLENDLKALEVSI